MMMMMMMMIRRRRSITAREGDVRVLCFCFTLTQLLHRWTDFHQIFTNRRLCGDGGFPIKVTHPPEKIGPKRNFLERKLRLRRLRTAVAPKRGRILGQIKQLV